MALNGLEIRRVYRPGNVRPVYARALVAQGLAAQVQGAYIWGPGLYMAYIRGPGRGPGQLATGSQTPRPPDVASPDGAVAED